MMEKRRRLIPLMLGLLLVSACAVKPTRDPRNPADVRNGPVLLRVCYIDGDSVHLAVGDQVELATSRLGRLRIRHLPADGSPREAWNGGDDVRVRSAILVERVDSRTDSGANSRGDSRANRTVARRFVPVGRFAVRVDEPGGHARFDFLASKATANLTNERYPECNVDLGDDEMLIRGVEDEERHGGTAHMR